MAKWRESSFLQRSCLFREFWRSRIQRIQILQYSRSYSIPSQQEHSMTTANLGVALGRAADEIQRLQREMEQKETQIGVLQGEIQTLGNDFQMSERRVGNRAAEACALGQRVN